VSPGVDVGLLDGGKKAEKVKRRKKAEKVKRRKKTEKVDKEVEE
jgi:hypothetical protein